MTHPIRIPYLNACDERYLFSSSTCSTSSTVLSQLPIVVPSVSQLKNAIGCWEGASENKIIRQILGHGRGQKFRVYENILNFRILQPIASQSARCSTHRQTPLTDNDSSLLYVALGKVEPLILTAARQKVDLDLWPWPELWPWPNFWPWP